MSPARKTLPPLFLIVMWTMALFVAGMLATVAQQAQDEDATRHLWDTAYIKQGAKRASARRPAKRSYRIATPQVPVTGVQADSVIGITLWRLRPLVPTTQVNGSSRMMIQNRQSGFLNASHLMEQCLKAIAFASQSRQRAPVISTLSIKSSMRMAQRASRI
jgi:hypothetical protein